MRHRSYAMLVFDGSYLLFEDGGWGGRQFHLVPVGILPDEQQRHVIVAQRFDAVLEPLVGKAGPEFRQSRFLQFW